MKKLPVGMAKPLDHKKEEEHRASYMLVNDKECGRCHRGLDTFVIPTVQGPSKKPSTSPLACDDCFIMKCHCMTDVTLDNFETGKKPGKRGRRRRGPSIPAVQRPSKKPGM